MGKIDGAGGRYDSTLQMFCDSTRDNNIEKLFFLRWLAKMGRLEHPVAGAPSGQVVEDAMNRGLATKEILASSVVQRGSLGRSQFEIGSIPGVPNRVGGLVQ